MTTAREQIRDFVQQIRDFSARPFVPGKTLIPATAPSYDIEEVANAVTAALEFRPAAGHWASWLERHLAEYVGVPHCRLVNSGSSANMLALAALMSPRLGDARLQPGDEVITTACGFPTTISPITRFGLTPVFVDVERPNYNVKVAELEAAVSSKTRAIILAHTLGFPFDVGAVLGFCVSHDLYLIEDACDALGAEWYGHKVGPFGHLSTLSFYPAHHMTTGEGGAVLTPNPDLDRIVTSLRDWGRDCYCAPGRDNTCGKRFAQENLGELPAGYDHKYVYSELGFNLKLTDMQAAIGCAQLEKVDQFVEKRRENWEFYGENLAELEDILEFQAALPGSRPSPFGFLMTVREDAPFSRNELVAKLEAAKIQTRPLFAGNMLRQPAMAGVKHRVVNNFLPESDRAMNRAFWIGVHPGVSEEMRNYVVETIRKEVHRFARR